MNDNELSKIQKMEVELILDRYIDKLMEKLEKLFVKNHDLDKEFRVFKNGLMEKIESEFVNKNDYAIDKIKSHRNEKYLLVFMATGLIGLLGKEGVDVILKFLAL